MRNFFYIVFGGLGAIIAGSAVIFAVGSGWDILKSHIPESLSMPRLAQVASAIVSAPTDGTAISGLRRTIRYTADEEEDLINAATIALPAGADGAVSANAYLVKDLTTGEEPIAYNAEKMVPIASLSKLVVAIMARKLIPSSDHITITDSIMNTYGNTADFKTGETFTASDLYYPLLMVSSNDAAEAFAAHYGRAKFLAAMNDFCQGIGAYRTYFDDPSGLSPKNVSTADDLALILEWIRKNDPSIIETTALKTMTVRSHTWVNPTHFLSWSYYIGGKNGYIPEANRTTASLFELGRNKNVYAVIVLGSSNRDADMIKLLGKVK